MKKIYLIIFILLMELPLVAQKFKTMELKPIVKQGSQYFYNLKKVHGGAYGLQLPLQSLEDDEINRRYKSYRTCQQVEGVLAIIPLVYILSVSRNQQASPNEFWLILGGSVIAIASVELIGQHHIKKGVERYNTLVIGASSQSLGAAITYKF